MKTEREIKACIRQTKKDYAHVLHGSQATLLINAPRAVLQLEAETKLRMLHWVLGIEYKSQLKGLDT